MDDVKIREIDVIRMVGKRGITENTDSILKGTHARDFHNVFLNFFLNLLVTNRYKTHYSQHVRKYS